MLVLGLDFQLVETRDPPLLETHPQVKEKLGNETKNELRMIRKVNL